MVFTRVAGVVIAGFLIAEPVLRKGAAAVFKAVIGTIFGVAMAGLELFTSLLDEIELDTMNEQLQEIRGDKLPTMSGALGDQVQQVVQGEETGRSLWWVVLVAAVLIAAMVLMFLTFRKKSGEVHSEETVTTVQVPERAKPSRYSNRGKVRQVYREFLRQEKKRGLLLKKDYTSEVSCTGYPMIRTEKPQRNCGRSISGRVTARTVRSAVTRWRRRRRR